MLWASAAGAISLEGGRENGGRRKFLLKKPHQRALVLSGHELPSRSAQFWVALAKFLLSENNNGLTHMELKKSRRCTLVSGISNAVSLSGICKISMTYTLES